jgi:hypothetical protein
MVAKKDALGFISVQNIIECQLLIVLKAIFQASMKTFDLGFVHLCCLTLTSAFQLLL